MSSVAAQSTTARASRAEAILLVLGIAALVALPFFIYPIFVMKMMCFALFACAF
ncbi:MAG: branched-chain amino acid ABC transporter permease, partial [Pseudaminobacter sp.]|nr:branched-chain amino acid ABC transporter permease [Pseudaminobacter sp.]